MALNQELAFEQFNQKNLDYRERWAGFEPGRFPSVTQGVAPEGQVPFSGTPLFSHLSASQKRALYLGLIKINAEAFTILEMLLLTGFRRLSHTPGLSAGERAALKKLIHEEFLHIKAFSSVLKSEAELQYPKKSVMLLQNHRMRSMLAWMAKNVPVALTLPAVKLEIYSMCYSRYLKECFGSWETNRWTKVHELHLLDEAHHVSLQFDVFEERILSGKGKNRLQTVMGVCFFFILLQFLLFGACRRVVAEAFPELSSFHNRRRSFRLIRWIVREYEPYRKTQAQVRSNFDRRKPSYRRFFSFLHW